MRWLATMVAMRMGRCDGNIVKAALKRRTPKGCDFWVLLFAGSGGEGEAQQRLLFHFVGFAGAGGWAGAGGALDGANAATLIFGDALEARHYIGMRAHVGGLFLDVDDFVRVGIRGDGFGNFALRKRIELIEE
jgi:hypothetical protein